MLLHPIDLRRDIPRNIGHKAFNIEIIAAKDAVQRAFFCAVPIKLNSNFAQSANSSICLIDDQLSSNLKEGQLFQPGEVTFSGDLKDVTAEVAASAQSDIWYWPVTHAGYKIYGHWLVDIIPRVLLCRRLSGKKVVCLLKSDTPAYACKLLDIMGIEHLPMSEYQGKTIVLLATVRRHDWLATDAFAVLRDATVEVKSKLVEASNSGDFDRLYISRRMLDKNSRSMTNHSEIEMFFAGNGFKVLFPETLPLSEQFEIFSKARIVVGEAGSALHNSVWSGETCRFLNLQSARQSHFIQSSLCKHFNQVVVNVFGETQTQDWTSPFQIDQELLERQIDQIADVNSEFWLGGNAEAANQ